MAQSEIILHLIPSFDASIFHIQTCKFFRKHHIISVQYHYTYIAVFLVMSVSELFISNPDTTDLLMLQEYLRFKMVVITDIYVI